MTTLTEAYSLTIAQIDGLFEMMERGRARDEASLFHALSTAAGLFSESGADGAQQYIRELADRAAGKPAG
jgi:hypothetical protein